MAALAGAAVLVLVWVAGGARGSVDTGRVTPPPAVAVHAQPPAEVTPPPAPTLQRDPAPPAASPARVASSPLRTAPAPAVEMASRPPKASPPPVQPTDVRVRPASVEQPAKSTAPVRRPAEEWLSPRLMKLGVRAGWRASAIGVDDPVLVRELQQTVAQLAVNHPANNRDVIFLGVREAADLARIERVRSALKSGGVLWVLFSPRTAPSASEIVDTAQTADLSLSRRVALSPTCDALSFVSPPASE